MIANSALLAALATFLLVGWLAGELSYLAPYKRAIFTQYGWHIGLATLIVLRQSERVVLPDCPLDVPPWLRPETDAHRSSAREPGRHPC